jgi:hypothetical protein
MFIIVKRRYYFLFITEEDYQRPANHYCCNVSYFLAVSKYLTNLLLLVSTSKPWVIWQMMFITFLIKLFQSFFFLYKACFKDGYYQSQSATLSKIVDIVKNITSASSCQQVCKSNASCQSWTLKYGLICALFSVPLTSEMDQFTTKKDFISGPKNC